MNDAAPRLSWVMFGDMPRHVSSFSGTAPGHRPAVRCPQCDRQLVLKLGSIRQHHAAHAPHDVCPATNPETALHINCKLALVTALRSAAGPDARLSILRQCAGHAGAECRATRIYDAFGAWDEVELECRVGEARRPDIVLRRSGVAIGAVEIVVSNRVSIEKADALRALSLPWIEVRGDAALTAPGAWSTADPLPVQRTSDAPTWRCPTHHAAHDAHRAAQAERAAAEHEAQRRATVLRASRVVDIYHASGDRDRLIYRITRDFVDGRVEAVTLRCGGRVVSTHPATGREGRAALRADVRNAFSADVKRHARSSESFADSPMSWATGATAESIVSEALDDRVGSDPTPLVSRYPRRWFYASQTRRWFLPSDMRRVRWDREPLDAFAAHPAWTRARTIVGERPAPPGSWKTPVFASRPLAALFGPARQPHAAGGPIGLVDVSPRGTPHGTAQRVIVVVEAAPSDASLEAVATELRESGADPIWLSHPLDWAQVFASWAWAPAGRDARGRGVVVIDNVGVFRAEQFVRALTRGDPRLTAAAIRRAMASRVEGMHAPR